MYFSLLRFGHHWKFPIKRAKKVKPSELAEQAEPEVVGEAIPKAVPATGADIDAARDWIRGNNPSLEEIEQRAQTPPQ